MQQRKRARKLAAEVGLVELLDRLELALTEIPARTSICKALSDLNQRLGSTGGKPAARPSRLACPRRQRSAVVESLPLFS
jgi:hypothetical protein